MSAHWKKGYIGYKVYGNTHQYYALISEDEISSVTINTYKWTPEGVTEAVEKILKDKIKQE